MRIALAGNPNSGKTTLFNRITGSTEYVGNWPGVTVEKKEGRLKGMADVVVTDLPGIYSLAPYSPEEVVARDHLVEDKPDAIINIVDGTNIERNLNLTTQLLELGIPMVVVVNMMDAVASRGDTLDLTKLEDELGVTVIGISALKGTGLEELSRIISTGKLHAPRHHITFDERVESVLSTIQETALAGIPAPLARWYSIKLFERDQKLHLPRALSDEQQRTIEAATRAVESEFGEEAESIVTIQRFDAIERIRDAAITYGSRGPTVTDRIDSVVTNKWLGLPIFAIVMFLVYYLAVTTVGAWGTDWVNDNLFGDGFYVGSGQTALDEATEAYETAVQVLEAGAGGSYEAYDDETGANEIIAVTEADVAEASAVPEPEPSDYGIWVPSIPSLIGSGLAALGTSPALESLVLDGIVAGVGAVLGFIPQMLVLFLLLAILEQGGYLTRVAFVLDRIFRRFGLSGKSFIPMLISSGCGIPGVMAARTIENPSDRRMTVMTTTFIPCSAKLPVIALIAGAVFGGAWWVAPVAYFMGVGSVLVSGIILRKMRAFASDTTPFLMELPEYHIPNPKTVLSSMWERASSFIMKAGTVILLSTIVIWFISSYGFVDGGFGAVEHSDASLLAAAGGIVAPLFAPLGWGDWQAVGATVTGLIAKENVVSTFAILYGDGGSWYTALQAAFLPVAGFSLLAFNLLCAPCFAAIGAIRREMNSSRWFWAAIGYQTAFAYAIALIIYQLGGLAVGETVFGPATIAAIAVLAGLLYLLFRPMPSSDRQAPVFTDTPAECRS